MLSQAGLLAVRAVVPRPFVMIVAAVGVANRRSLGLTPYTSSMATSIVPS